MTLTLLAALVGTFGYGAASVLQAIGTAEAKGMAVLRRTTYVAGLACDVLAWLASLLALRQLAPRSWGASGIWENRQL